MSDLDFTSDIDKPLTYTVARAAALLGVSRNTAYEAVRTRQLPAIRIGRRIVIPRDQLHRMLAGANDV